MSDLRDQYFATLDIDPSDLKDSPLTRALNRAYQLRTFEIEHYWKRATYFWGFQIAIFAAIGLLWRETDAGERSPITVALSALGILTALANFLSAHGSKFWQENWERHIDMLEDKIEGRLHKTVWLSGRHVEFSVSRVNQKLSLYFIVFWIMVAVYVAWKFTGSLTPSWLGCVASPWSYLLIMSIAVLFGAVWLFSQTSRLRGTVPNADGTHGAPFKSRSRCSSVDVSEPSTFIRRYAPDEMPQS